MAANLLILLGSWWIFPALEFHSQRESAWSAHASPVREIHYALGGEVLISRGEQGGVNFWNTRDASARKTELGRGWQAYRCAVSPGGELLAVVDEKVIHIADLVRWKETATINDVYGPGIESVTFSPDGKRLAAGGDPIVTWTVADGETVGAKIRMGLPRATGLAFRADSATLLTAERNLHSVYEWSLETGKQVGEFGVEDGPSKRPEKIIVAPSGKRILVSTWLGRVVEWDAQTHEMTRTMQAHQNGLGFNCFALSADGKTLVTAQGNGSFWLPSHLRVWRFRDWKLVREFRTPRPFAVFDNTGWAISALAISPDSKWIACGHESGQITVWRNPNKAKSM